MNKHNKRLATENVPQHLFEMEDILNRATQKMDAGKDDCRV